MPINRWRSVRYEGDGCDCFQCLLCYKEWIAHTAPGHGWSFCPYCGTKWDGQQKTKEEHHPIAPREEPAYILVVQGRSLFDGWESEWKDTYVQIRAGEGEMYGHSSHSAYVFHRWLLEIAEAKGQEAKEKKSHAQYCKYTGQHTPFSPLAVHQLRLVQRKNGQDKVILQYLPTRL